MVYIHTHTYTRFFYIFRHSAHISSSFLRMRYVYNTVNIGVKTDFSLLYGNIFFRRTTTGNCNCVRRLFASRLLSSMNTFLANSHMYVRGDSLIRRNLYIYNLNSNNLGIRAVTTTAHFELIDLRTYEIILPRVRHNFPRIYSCKTVT